MPSKFGGIPVEAGGSKFGSVPVREQPELSLATSATDSRPAPGYSGELPQSKPTENDKAQGVGPTIQTRPSLFRADSDFRKRAGLGVGDMFMAAAKDMFGGDPAQYLADQYNKEHGLSAQINGGAKVVRDAGGNAMVRLPNGTQYRTNNKGIDSQDVANVAGNVAAFFLPASWAGRAAQARNLGLLGRMGMQAGAAGATDMGLQAATNGGQVDMRRAALTAAGGAGGELAGAGLRQVGRLASAENANPVVQQAITFARNAGIPLHVSQITNSKPIKTMASVVGYLPLSGTGKASARQQDALHRALSRTMGEDSSVLSDDVMKAARERLSREYGDIYKGKHIAVSDDAARRMAGIVNEASGNLTDDEAAVVAKQFDKIIRKSDGVSLTGEQYQSLRTSLSDAIDGSNKGRYIKQLRNVLDEMAGLGMNPRDAARLNTARGQWANMRSLEDALKNAPEGLLKGHVSPGQLKAAVRNGSTAELRDLARVGQLLKDPIPDSGTAGRQLMLGLLGGAGAFGGLPAFGGLAKLGLAGATAGRAFNSPAAANLLLGGQRLAPPVTNALARTAPASGALVMSEQQRRDKRYYDGR